MVKNEVPVLEVMDENWVWKVLHRKAMSDAVVLC
jgi:hypothetical protein